MLVSTKGRYALRVMIDIAEHNTGEYIPLKEIARRQEISEKYLESIISVLKKADFLTGMRGKGGGYKLTKQPHQYTVGSILRLTEDSLSPVACLQDNPNQCPHSPKCRTLPMWRRLDNMINDYFDGITIADLAKENNTPDNYII